MRYVSLWLAAVCVVVFLVQSAIPGFTEAFLLSSGALSAPWTFVTSIFLHGSPSHLMFNMFALVLFGLMLEKFIGARKFIAIFFISGLAASIAAFLVYDASLGASGAVYGVIGALAAIRPRMVVWTYGAPMPMVVAAGFYLLLDIAGVFFPSNVANAAHIAGLIIGALIAFPMRDKTRQEKRKSLLDEKRLEEWEDEWM